MIDQKRGDLVTQYLITVSSCLGINDIKCDILVKYWALVLVNTERETRKKGMIIV